jgi:hypothetical protein
MASGRGASHAGPQRLGQALSDLIGLRGYARPQGDAQLQSAWASVAGGEIAGQTRAVAIRRGVLQVSVAQAPLLSELAGYFRQSLVAKLGELHADLNIRDIKFRLDSGVAARGRRPASPPPEG